MPKPLVSIVTISYNQENYIKDALESFVTQKTKFPFEAIIADDCSTDQTPEIIQDYANRYPDIITPILRQKNIGVQANLFDAMQKATGKYIALCEGDDYWTEHDKLQLQVDFMEGHPDHNICFHTVRVFFEGNVEPEYLYPGDQEKKNMTTNELLVRNFIQTNSVMYRTRSYDELPQENMMPIDWYLHLLHAYDGKIGYIDRVMSAYRRHPGGIWWGSANRPDVMWQKYDTKHVAFYDEVRKVYGNNKTYAKSLLYAITSMFNSLLEIDKQLNNGLLDRALKTFPETSALFMRGEHQAYINALNTIDKNHQLHVHDVTVRDTAIEAMKKDNLDLLTQRVQVERQLTGITNSRTYRTAQKVVRPYRKVRRAARRKLSTKKTK